MDFAVESHFNKIFRLIDKNDKLGDDFLDRNLFTDDLGSYEALDVAWKLSQKLYHMKIEINNTTDRLDRGLDKWHEHTHSTYLGGKVQWRVQKSCKPELLTQAWLKFYQILKTFDLVSFEKKALSSLHLCEAPGAFITSLNHYLQQENENQLKWDWKASTLNPHYEGNPGLEMVSDDRFIVRTVDHWDFGPDGIGDIKKLETGRHLAALGPFDLITADGSVDCQENPGEQEKTVAALLTCETTTALSALNKGGNFVLKTFTWFDISSWSLLSLLCHCFESVTAIKPVCSKEGNSEVYVVCQSFKGLPEHWSVQLWNHYGESMSAESIPDKVMTRILEGATFFTDFQEEAIRKNLDLYKCDETFEAAKKNINRFQNEIANSFLERFSLWNEVENTVSPNTKYQKLHPLACPWSSDQLRLIRSSLQMLDTSKARDVLELLIPSLMFKPVDASGKISLRLPAKVPMIQSELRLKYGKRFGVVTNSRLCAPLLLQLHRFCRHLYCLQVPEPGGLNFLPGTEWKTVILDKLHTLGLGKKFCVSGINLFTYVEVGILVLLTQQFEQCYLVEITPTGCTFEFIGFKGVTPQLECALTESILNDEGQQLLEVVPIASILYGDLHPLVEQANQQTVLRLAQATLALLPEIEVTD